MKTLIKILCLSVLWFSCESPAEPEPQDTTSPIVAITYPVSESQLTETTIIRAEISDDSPITKVIFFIDGISVFEDIDSPYEYEWDICSEDNENHTILVKAEDESGNQGQTDAMPIQTNGAYDCNAICGGDAIVDECGVCDLDTSNDCEQDCNGIWGGDNEGYIKLWGECYNIETTTELYLGFTQLTGEIPPEIGNLVNLTTLDLHLNQLTGEIPSEMWNLTNLTFFHLGYNQLTGEIPPEIGNLTNLTYLRLSDNQLTGEIPPEIGNLVNLTTLDLHLNQLTGEIPSEIGNLINLSELVLSSNQLTGEIPETICSVYENIPSWGTFTISNNQLCPPYPECVENYVGEQDTSNCP